MVCSVYACVKLVSMGMLLLGNVYTFEVFYSYIKINFFDVLHVLKCTDVLKCIIWLTILVTMVTCKPKGVYRWLWLQ